MWVCTVNGNISNEMNKLYLVPFRPIGRVGNWLLNKMHVVKHGINSKVVMLQYSIFSTSELVHTLTHTHTHAHAMNQQQNESQ